MTDDQRALVADAVRVAKDWRGSLTTAVPFWPLGLPGWDDPWVALGQVAAQEVRLFVWARDPERSEVTLDLADLAGLGLPFGDEVEVEQVFPAALPPWTTRWDPADSTLHVTSTSGVPAARVLRLSPAQH